MTISKLEARLEERDVKGTGWYVYVDGQDCGGPFETERDALEHWAPGTPAREYRVALVKTDGSWDVIDTFEAASDAAANAYAEEHHADVDWYVIDAEGRNINGGRDQ